MAMEVAAFLDIKWSFLQTEGSMGEGITHTRTHTHTILWQTAAATDTLYSVMGHRNILLFTYLLPLGCSSFDTVSIFRPWGIWPNV